MALSAKTTRLMCLLRRKTGSTRSISQWFRVMYQIQQVQLVRRSQWSAPKTTGIRIIVDPCSEGNLLMRIQVRFIWLKAVEDKAFARVRNYEYLNIRWLTRTALLEGPLATKVQQAIPKVKGTTTTEAPPSLSRAVTCRTDQGRRQAVAANSINVFRTASTTSKILISILKHVTSYLWTAH